jgi:hypothetical protein
LLALDFIRRHVLSHVRQLGEQLMGSKDEAVGYLNFLITNNEAERAGRVFEFLSQDQMNAVQRFEVEFLKKQIRGEFEVSQNHRVRQRGYLNTEKFVRHSKRLGAF